MKVNKKVVVSTGAVLGVAALVAGGTIAYFTDKKSADNNFTVGDVKIEMYESQLHRENSGRKGVFSALSSDPHYCDYTSSQTNVTGKGDMISYDKARYCTPGIDADNTDGISAVTNGHTAADRNWGYSDADIIADATNETGFVTGGFSAYFDAEASGIVPGQWVRKFTYVKNTSNNNNADGSEAYVLIRYMVPVAYADNLDIKIPGTPYEEDVDAAKDGVQGYFTAVNRNDSNGQYSAYALNEHGIDDYTGYTQTIDNVEYKVYAAVTTDVVNPGEMTFWSPVNTVRLKTESTNTGPLDATNYVAPQAQIDVKVDAQAIQAKTFSDAIDAINHL